MSTWAFFNVSWLLFDLNDLRLNKEMKIIDGMIFDCFSFSLIMGEQAEEQDFAVWEIVGLALVNDYLIIRIKTLFYSY